MITARNRFEGCLRTLQDLMLRINMREGEEVEMTASFIKIMAQGYKDMARTLDESLVNLTNPDVRPTHTVCHLAQLPPGMPSAHRSWRAECALSGMFR